MSVAKGEDLFDTLDKIELPDLEADATEESTYFEEPEEARSDHKEKEKFDLVLAKATEQVNKLKNENEKLAIENGNLKKLAEHRETYSWAILAFVIATVIATFYIIIQASTPTLFPILDNGKYYKLLITKYVMSDQVIMMLLGTTLAQVLGILWLVVNWLYPSNNNHIKSKGQQST